MGFRDLAGDLEVEPSRVLVCEGLGWGPEGGTVAGVPGCAVGCGLWAVGLWDAPSYTAVENPCMRGLRLTATTLSCVGMY